MTCFLNRRTLIACAVLSLATLAIADLPKASPASAGMSAERLQRLRPLIQKEIYNQQMPGAVVMVARKGAVVFSDDIGVKHDAIFRA